MPLTLFCVNLHSIVYELLVGGGAIYEYVFNAVYSYDQESVTFSFECVYTT